MAGVTRVLILALIEKSTKNGVQWWQGELQSWTKIIRIQMWRRHQWRNNVRGDKAKRGTAQMKTWGERVRDREGRSLKKYLARPLCTMIRYTLTSTKMSSVRTNVNFICSCLAGYIHLLSTWGTTKSIVSLHSLNLHHIQLSMHQENQASWSGCMSAIQALMQDIMESLRRLWIAKMLLVPMASVVRKNGYLLVPSCIQRFTRTISKYMVNFDSSRGSLP